MDSLIDLEKKLPELESALGYKFKDKSYLINALTHCSFVNENPKVVSKSNERLEFLGDAILQLIVSEHLYNKLPDKPEGDLSNLRSQVVDAKACAIYLEHFKALSFLLVGKGEKINLDKGNQSIGADLFEAIIGAVYLDCGLEGARQFFLKHFEEHIANKVAKPDINWKALFQTYVQKTHHTFPEYKILSETGPFHAKEFHVAALCAGKQLGEGKGNSKKEAEQHAAQMACHKLGIDE